MTSFTILRLTLILAIVSLILSSQAWAHGGLVQNTAAKSVESREFRAGADATDVGPTTFPVLVNGGFLQSTAKQINDSIYAKSLVLDDGSMRLAIVVVDSCMMPRELLDRAKKLATEKTGIPAERILISATHTHSAPAAMGALGCPVDANYVSILPGRIAESIVRATKQLGPAQIGWAVIEDHEHTFCRRWILRPDKMLDDPFGQRNVRANMHPGFQNPDAIAPAGPVDPALTVLSVQSRNGRPIAVLANYSMHYFGANPVSADYFGRFSAALAKQIGAEAVDPPFIGIMSQGTSGDQMWMDYGQAKKEIGLNAYADAVAQYARRAYQSITYRNWAVLSMVEAKLVVGRRLPDESRLALARAIVGRMGNREAPGTLPEVYAKESIFLHQEPKRELKLQVIRIDGLGITAIPNEVFAITGLKIKAQSPLETTMNIELANGSEGYIPPPEQHALGGYTTWPARTAGLEVEAEPKIVDAILRLLEQVSGKPRRALAVSHGRYAKSVLASKPLAYWRLGEIQGPTALDTTGHGHHAHFMGGVALNLSGPDATGLSADKHLNRAVHFAGGRLEAAFDRVADEYSIELWFWNGLPNDARSTTGILFSVGAQGTGKPGGAKLGIGGTKVASGRLFIGLAGTADMTLAGRTDIMPKTWHHVALVRDRQHARAYLDGDPKPEIYLPAEQVSSSHWLTVASDGNSGSTFEGKIDEVAFYDRALDIDEVINHVRAAEAPRNRGRESPR